MASYKKKYEELMVKAKRLQKERDDWQLSACVSAALNLLTIALLIVAIFQSAGV